MDQISIIQTGGFGRVNSVGQVRNCLRGDPRTRNLPLGGKHEYRNCYDVFHPITRMDQNLHISIGRVWYGKFGRAGLELPTAVIHEHMESADTSNNVTMQGSVEKSPSVRVGQVRADSVGAGSIRAGSVGAGSEPAPTAAIYEYPEPAPTAVNHEYLEPARMCSNPINQDGSNLPLSNRAGLVRVGQVGRAGSGQFVGAGLNLPLRR
jgi:hypothetical protein